MNAFVVVIDGMLPENVTATETPNLCNLIGCPGAAAPDASAHTTVYGAARAVMVSQTNANHTAMMTGAYGATNGIVANNAYDRTANQAIELERPELIRVDTLFDVLRREAAAPQDRGRARQGEAARAVRLHERGRRLHRRPRDQPRGRPGHARAAGLPARRGRAAGAARRRATARPSPRAARASRSTTASWIR